nr:hypothetical protein [uncultured Acetatifactor sp.]
MDLEKRPKTNGKHFPENSERYQKAHLRAIRLKLHPEIRPALCGLIVSFRPALGRPEQKDIPTKDS